MNMQYNSTEVAELFILQFDKGHIRKFLNGSQTVHRFLSNLPGYNGLDILFLSDTEVNVLIRWKDFKQFETHLATILNACPVTAWFGHAVTINHRPAFLKSVSEST